MSYWFSKEKDMELELERLKEEFKPLMTCIDCEYHVGENRCPIHEKQNNNTICKYFLEW